MVEECEIGFDAYYETASEKEPKRDGEEQDKYVERLRGLYKSLVSAQASTLSNKIQPNWATEVWDSVIETYSAPNLVIDLAKAQTKLNSKLSSLLANLELRLFLAKFERQVHRIQKFSAVQISEFKFQEFEKFYSTFNYSPKPPQNVCKELSELILDTTYFHPKIKKEAEHIFQTGDYPTQDSKLHCQQYSQKARDLLHMVRKALLTPSTKLLHRPLLSAAGLFPRLTPTALLPMICSAKLKHSPICEILGAIAVLWTLEQKCIRCYKYKKAGALMKFALKREIQNDGHSSWCPKERPEWLLLELELDIMIRKIQVEVAEHMLLPKDNKSSLMQLNMGEGKTSVILPMLIASLANGNQLARVTVLKSLFHTNSEFLRVKLGGLLNQRFYTFPCRRDMGITSNEARTMQQVYQECVEKTGFVVTLPEHRLSFQLKGYEKCRSGSLLDASELVKLQQWLYENARDVLDESDEILNVKYQLIYTIGDSVPASGGKARWLVLQKLLKLVPYHLTHMIETEIDGVDLGECRYSNLQAKSLQIFPLSRIFKPECYEKLCSLLVADILSGNTDIQIPELINLNPENRNTIAKFLTYPTIEKSVHEEVLSLFPKVETDINGNIISSSQLDTLLILRGILACGVLLLGLTKRWRVNYGENPQAKELGRLMAVPYKAKDVATEKTEFGHPDVAIVLTQLSYYYSGLTDLQLMDVFKTLRRQPKPDLEYESWIGKMDVDSSIKYLSGVNLHDYEQRTKIIFPALRMNMAVIDFWLNNYVYPRESKVFGHKLMCSPWDLTSDTAQHPVTGFSGTNDTAVLLPLHVSQNDLPQLEDTNDKVRKNILREENNLYEALPAGFLGLDILEKLVASNTTLLLDVGALILELSNEQVAEEWLNLIPDTHKIEAAVYFDSSDRLMVRDRLGRESRLELSPYLTRLDHCVIYLDDAHTRGTDLKLPIGTKGCVTLGKAVTRDKLVQGCMRMRLLGNGHTLRFLASHEVDIEVSAICGVTKCEKVLNWASSNSNTAIQEGFVHWANSGLNYLNKKTSQVLFQKFLTTECLEDYRKLGDRCTEAETTDLMAMYGEFRTEESFTKIIQQRLALHKKSFVATCNEEKAQFGSLIENEYRLVGQELLDKCKLNVADDVKKRACLLDEEQERELEKHDEDERQDERPGAAIALTHSLDPELKNCVLRSSCELSLLKCLVKLPQVLAKTKLWSMAQENSWGTNIFATQDFVRVVKIVDKVGSVDEYMRPPTWIASLTQSNVSTLVFLSPFEANELMPIFRSGYTKFTLHMFAPRLHPKQSTLLSSSELWVPGNSGNFLDYFQGFNQLNSNLLLFSGSQYFENEAELAAFCQLTGYITRPARTEQEREAFNKHWTDNGFVKTEFRHQISPELSETCHFTENPEKLILGIIKNRHEGYTPKCHVYRVVAESARVTFD